MFFLLSDLLKNAAEHFPAKPAVVCNREAISYAELAELAEKIASALIEGGLHPGERVGIYAPKSLHAVAALCGVLQAGGVYVPLDPSSPAPRNAAICQNSQIRFLLTVPALLPTIRTIVAVNEPFHWIGFLEGELYVGEQGQLLAKYLSSWESLSHQMPQHTRPALVENDLAYMLYTSGSTGIPKGVMLSHRNALSFVEWAKEAFAISVEDRLANHAPFHFDLSIFDIFVSFAAGATLLLVPPEIAAFPADLVHWIEREQVTIWYSVPSILKMMLHYGMLGKAQFSTLRLVLFAGEVFPLKHLRALVEALPAVAFCNLYGPTETNVCTYYRISPEHLPQITDLPIGKPCEHCDVFAINAQGELVQQEEEEGELYVRGPSVMQGYWGNDAATREALVELAAIFPHLKGLAYRTGDIVRKNAQGDFIFIGRKDHLIKSRGYRIEPGEIEAILHTHPAIEAAVVIPLADELIGNRLEACVVFIPGSAVRPEELRAYCAKRLPGYMVPDIIHIYTSLYMTSTAKIDRTRLRSELAASTSSSSIFCQE